MLNKTLSESVTITATLDEAESWEWYLNGDFISGEQNNNITITSATLSYGRYTLSVKAYKDSIPYSAFIEFDVHN
jgi:PKD repeat protein